MEMQNKLSQNRSTDKNKSRLTKLSISLKGKYFRLFKKYNYLKTLSALIIFFILLSPWLQPRAQPGFEFLDDETGIMELIQAFLLVFHLYILVRNYKLVNVITRKKYFLAKISLVLFLIYEELSFLTAGLTEFAQGFNIQHELNIHNAEIFTVEVLKGVPLFGGISVMPIILTLFFILWGFGSYLSIPDESKFLFLDKKFSIYSQIYLINFLVTRFLAMPYNIFVIDPELVELLFYLIFLLDTRTKNSKAKYKA